VLANKLDCELTLGVHEAHFSQAAIFRDHPLEVIAIQASFAFMVSDPQFKTEIVTDRHHPMEGCVVA